MSFSRAIINEAAGLINLLLSYHSKGRLFRKELPEQAIAVFIRATFPRVIRMSKIYFYAGSLLGHFMLRKSNSVVISDGQFFLPGNFFKSPNRFYFS